MMLMSLRSLIRSQWWWAVVLVLWTLVLLGITYTFVEFVQAIAITLIVAVAKGAEYLTRPAQTARQAGRHSAKKA